MDPLNVSRLSGRFVDIDKHPLDDRRVPADLESDVYSLEKPLDDLFRFTPMTELNGPAIPTSVW